MYPRRRLLRLLRPGLLGLRLDRTIGGMATRGLPPSVCGVVIVCLPLGVGLGRRWRSTVLRRPLLRRRLGPLWVVWCLQMVVESKHLPLPPMRIV